VPSFNATFSIKREHHQLLQLQVKDKQFRSIQSITGACQLLSITISEHQLLTSVILIACSTPVINPACLGIHV